MSTTGYNDEFPRKFGNYHLLAPLAQGGMGALYLAVKGDRGLERLLVIKTVLPHLADAEYIARFRDEAKIVVKLSHANLIPVFDAGSVDGELYMAMDFVEGRDLRAVWNRCAKKQVAFPIDVAVYVVKELVRGLGYAHSFRGLELVHRDVSPPNVLISYSGEVKVMDFGLANSTMKMEKTAPGIIYGKVAYMSPEQARGEPLDGRSDLYAAAIILWELLTGRQLFPPGKDQPHDLLQRARNPTPMPPSQRAPRVHGDLDEICMKGLMPNREDRYRDGEEFRQALADWIATETPGTDAARLENFLNDLFAEDIERERAEREKLLSTIRTKPPTDELRQIIEDSDSYEGGLRRDPTSPGRRAGDRGEPATDRRGRTSRRRADTERDSDGGDIEKPRSRTPDELAPGQILDNRYRISKLIGEGGMGKVYEAEHVEIGRRVAIKILHPVYSRMPDLVERFRQEARAASRIGHPNIVDVTDSGKTANGSTYFVMEYLEGEELGDIIARDGALDISRALRIVIQICRALAAAHQASIIHRDLKPENIFLTPREDNPDFVKVLDFGVATSLESGKLRTKRLTTPGTTMGTPEYMAPEQAAGSPANERCDIYALGSILYESLTGQAPYSGDNFMAILTLKATKDPVAPDRLRPELSPDIVNLIKRAMSREPDDRPATMDALEMELERLLLEREPSMGVSPALAGGGRLLRAASQPGIGPVIPRRPDTNRPHDIDAHSEPTVAVTHTVQVNSRLLLIGGLIAAIAFVVAIIIYLTVTDKKSPDEAASPTPDARVAAPIDAGLAPAIDAAPPVDAAPPADAAPVDAGSVARDARKPVGPARIASSEAEKLLAQAESSNSRGEAKKLFERVARSASSSKHRKRANLGLAEIAYQSDQLDKVIKYATKAKGNWKADLWLGRAYKRLGKKDQAIKHYRNVLRVKPGHPESRKAVAELTG